MTTLFAIDGTPFFEYEGDLRATITAAVAQGVTLRLASLAKADLSGITFAETDLSGADLRESDLRGADLTTADLADANLTGALLTQAQVNNLVERGYDVTMVVIKDA